MRENLRYACHRGHLDRGENRCLSFGGTVPDREVGREVLRALEPAALEAARLAAEEERVRDDDVLRARRLEVQEAHYRAERTRRHYEAVDPEHRLVASELERRWNEALTHVAEAETRLEQDLAGHDAGPVALPSEAELAALADDLSRVWDDERTDWAMKKRIVRTLVEEIVVDTDADRRELVFLMHWKGGAHTEVRQPWRRRGFSSAHTPEAIVAGVRELVKVNDDEYIAGCLNRNGLKTGYGREWSKTAVVSLRAHHHIPVHSPERRRAEGWLTLTEAASLAGVSTVTLRRSHERGEVAASHPFPVGPYILRRADLTEEFISRLACRVAKHNRWGRRYESETGTLFESST